MASVTHLVVTDNFAGTERYVCELATASSQRGWTVTVIGGQAARMTAELGTSVRWLPGSTLTQACRSLYRVGRQDICHTHLTAAETVAGALRYRHRSRMITTRHIAAPRGSSRGGRLAAPLISRSIDREIAISHFVADRIAVPEARTIHNGVHRAQTRWRPENRVVLMVQRLEPEKATALGLRAWARSGLADRGWVLRIVGDGSERPQLESTVRTEAIPAVQFLGRRDDVDRLMSDAGIMLATAAQEPLGLSVLEAMALGVPVVATRSGGHLETLAPQQNINGFEPGDHFGAAECLRRLAQDDDLRREVSHAGRERQASLFSLTTMVDQILAEYRSLGITGPSN